LEEVQYNVHQEDNLGKVLENLQVHVDLGDEDGIEHRDDAAVQDKEQHKNIE